MSVPPGSIVAVTGASGFIGSHVVDALLRKGYAVRAVVRDPSDDAKTAHLAALAAACGGAVTFARGDLLEPGSFDGAFAGAAAVVHCAAVVEILHVKDPVKDIVDPSLKGCENVLASVARHAGTIKKVVHTSSCIAVAAVDTKRGAPYDEADANAWSTVERDPYGYAKTAAEALVREKCAAMAMPLATINPGVTLGPCLTKAHTKASTVLLRELLYGNRMLNYNCSFVDVRDVGAAHAAAVASAATGRFLCVGDEGAMNTLDLGPIARAACPQWRTEAVPKYPAALVGVLGAVHALPLVGPSLAGLAGVTELGLRVFEETIAFSNARAKRDLGLAFTPLPTTVKDGMASMVEGGWVKPRTT